MPSLIVRDVTLKELNRALDELWDDLRTDADTQAAARTAGIDLDHIPATDRAEVISLSRDAQGIDPSTLEILVTFAPLAATIAEDVWTHFILPRLIHRFGSSKVKTRED